MDFQSHLQTLLSASESQADTLPSRAYERAEAEKRAMEAELLERYGESLAIYQPTPFQEQFHACTAKQCLLKKGQQTGGSIALLVELARAVTGQDPYGKYPKENGVAVILGMSLDHLGINIHPYLFEGAKFKIIRDRETHEWRPFRPWEPDDVARKKEAVDAPPLIPERYVKGGYAGIKYEDRGKNIFTRVEFVNGWVLHGMGSQGVPKAGFQADLVCIDEDLERSSWYQEMIARLLIRDGLLRWAALPYGHNDAIQNMIELAEDEAKEPEPQVVCIEATIYDNPYMPEKSRDATMKAWRQESEEVYQMRAFGTMRLGCLMYPTFYKHVHCIPRPEGLGKLYELLMKRNGNPPEDWCRYKLTDPGHTTCGVLFVAVPPPEEFGDYAVCYDECYIHECDAPKYGLAVSRKARDQQFEMFICDMHGGKLRDIGSGQLPHVQYSRELAKHGIFSNRTGSGFWPGVPDEASRQTSLRRWLSIRDDGTTKFQVLSAFCPNLVNEITRLKRRIDAKTGVVLDEKRLHSKDHLTDLAEYAAANGLPYVRPRGTRRVEFNSIQAMRSRLDALVSAQTPQDNFINLGPQGVS